MGVLKLCIGKQAKNPYFFAPTGAHMYTLEELCWHIMQNGCLLDENIIGTELFEWIGDELGLSELSAELAAHQKKYNDFCSSAAFLLEKSQCCSAGQIEEFKEELSRISDKTPVERLKIRSDRLLSAGKIRQAAQGYIRLLEDDCTSRMTEELAGNIWHNLGVCYARDFLFEEAADSFKKACKLRRSEESVLCYLYALNFLDEYDDGKDPLTDISYAKTTKALSRINEVSSGKEYMKERTRLQGREKPDEILLDWINRYAKMMG